MSDNNKHSALITTDNAALADLELSWRTAEFTVEDGIGPLRSLHEFGDALVAVAKMEQDGLTILGSGVMVGPGLLLTATHVLDEFPRDGGGPVFLTFLPGAARAWLPIDVVTISGRSEFDESRKVVSDLSLVSCTLNSTAHASLPLMLAPMQIALPLVGERLWATGFRHQGISGEAALVTPFISSGLVTAAYPNGRGERMASPCFEVDMSTIGGMSGGAVVNADGNLVGIVSSSFEGGPSYITLIWDAVRLSVKGATPKLAAREKVSLLKAKSLGLAKLKGNVRSDPWGDVTFRLTGDEAKLFTASIPASKIDGGENARLNDDEREAFEDKWGPDMEAIASEAAIDTIGAVSLSKMRAFLEASDIPKRCLEAIDSFSVEDFDGVEDFIVTAVENLGDGKLRIDFYFDLSMLVWMVTVKESVYREIADDFRQYFMNIEPDGTTIKMETVQRYYFKATMVFDQAEELFSDVSISSVAIKRPRSAALASAQ